MTKFPCTFPRNREIGGGDEFADDCLHRQFLAPKSMVASMLEGEGHQIEAFANLLFDWKLSDALRGRDWRRFALKYNGPNALKHGYDRKLGAAFKKYSGLAARAVAKPGTNKSFVFLSGF